MTFLRFRILLALGVACVLPLRASEPLDFRSLGALTMEKWSKANGLPAHAVHTVVRTHDGYLWVGTDEGLARYDGSRFTVYNGQTSPGLGSNVILSLAVGRDQTLWIGTAQGLSSLDRGTFRARGFAGERIIAILPGRDGVLWVGTTRGLFRSRDGNAFEREGEPLGEADIRAIAEDADGVVWVGTNGHGLVTCRGAGVCAPVEAPSIRSVRSLHRAGKGGMWVGTQESGLYHLGSGSLRRWTKADSLSSDSVYALLETADGSLWIGTNGAGITRLRNGRLERVHDQNAPMLLRSLFEDDEGNVWAGAVDGGLTRFSRSPFAMLRASDGLASDVVLAVHETADGDLWVGSAGKGLSRFHRGEWHRYDRSSGLPNDVVLTIHSDGRGDVWIGTAGGGLTRFRAGRFTTFTKRDGLRSDVVTAVLPSRDGSTLWIGTTGGGLHRMIAGRIEPFRDWRKPSSIQSLLESSDGALWIGTEGDGAARIHNGTVTRLRQRPEELQDDTVVTFVEDSTRAIWMGTAGGGLSRWKNGRVVTLTTRHGLREDTVQQILDDGRGSFWLGGNHGISRVSLSQLQAVADGSARQVRPRAFDTTDGLGTDETNGGVFPSAWRGRGGVLYFPTMSGLAAADPRPCERGGPLRPLIEQVLTGEGPPVLREGNTFQIRPRTERFEITYSAPSMRGGKHVTYRYTLEGFDSGWVLAGNRQVAQYTRVPPGRYRFRVAARRGPGDWSEVEGTAPIDVAPAYFETRAFRAGVAIVILLAALVLHRARTAKLRRRNAQLEQLMREREAAVESLHRSEAHFRRLIENASDLVMIAAPDGVISYVSPSAERVLGRRPDDATGVDLRTLVRAEDARLLDQVLLDPDGEGQISTAQVQIPFEDLPNRHLELVVQRLHLEEGDRLIINCRDITERKVLEKRLEQANRIASMGHLAATIAHEFNNVLMSISAMAEVLRRADTGSPRSGDLARNIISSVTRGKRITEDILRFARDTEPSISAIALGSWTRALECELASLLGEKVQVRVTCSVPALSMAGDPQQLMQVFTNLALNARDAMADHGSISIGFRPAVVEEVRKLGLSGPFVHVDFRDDGSGIPPDVLPHIFEPLFTTKRSTGTGIGLAVVHRVVTRHGGHIAVTSQPGSGTTFHIFLPVASMAAEEPERQRPDTPTDVPLLNVLLVEDDQLVANGLKMNLEDLGASVEIVTLGRDALAAVRRSRPDAVVLDVALPDSSGAAVFEEIARVDPLLPVIFSTGHADVEMLDGYLSRPNVAFLRKPYAVGKLMAMIQELVTNRTGNEAGRAGVDCGTRP